MQAKTVSKIAEKILKTVGGDDQDMIWQSSSLQVCIVSEVKMSADQIERISQPKEAPTVRLARRTVAPRIERPHNDHSCTWHDSENKDPPVRGLCYSL